MTIKDELINNQKIIFDMLETFEGHLKPKAMSIVADDVRYLLLGLAGALIQYVKAKGEWALNEKAATALDQLDKDYSLVEKQFLDYKQAWVTPDVIESSPEQFVQISKEIMTNIYKYLDSEKEKLTPLI